MAKKTNLEIIPHPDKILVKITKESWDNLFFKWITRDDGSKCQLFTALEESEGFDKRYTQNVSVGVVLAVGDNIKTVFPSDLVILDYLASNNEDVFVGYIGGDKLISIRVITTYHTYDAKPFLDGRRAFVVGDFDEVSAVLGVVRKDKVIAFDPYIFLNHKSNIIIKTLPSGHTLKEEEKIVTREVLSAPEDSGFKDGDQVIVKEPDIFTRTIGMKEISVLFKIDVLVKK